MQAFGAEFFTPRAESVWNTHPINWEPSRAVLGLRLPSTLGWKSLAARRILYGVVRVE